MVETIKRIMATTDKAQSPWRFCVAPMMEWTDRHCRMLMRRHSRHARLYTEMITAPAVLFGDRQRLLGYDAQEHPLAVQLGGSDLVQLAEAAAICEDYGYAEINLNVGCPSDRVQNGAFGACLMRQPELVADCVQAMKQRVQIPVTVKCRLGVDDQEPQSALFAMAQACVAAGTEALIVHARKAWLKGLSPKENRDIPPLNYQLVRQLKLHYPHTHIILNGGLTDLVPAQAQLDRLDGVMIGRAAYHNLSMLLAVDPIFFDQPAPYATSFDALEAYLAYAETQIAQGTRIADISRHMLGLFAGVSGARAYRQHLSVHAPQRGATIAVLAEALAKIRETAAQTAQ